MTLMIRFHYYLAHTQVESYGLRKRSYTGKIRSFTTAFRRITCDRITIVYGRLRPCMFDRGSSLMVFDMESIDCHS